jgi:hypothetical protein
MLRIIVLAIAFLANASTISTAQAACGQGSEIAAARVRWALVRQHNEGASRWDSCRAYSAVFLEAVNARHVVSLCEQGAIRNRNLEMLDADIDAFNNLIAEWCNGS